MFGVALDAVAILDELAEELPEGRAYIRDQLRRAANSVALNALRVDGALDVLQRVIGMLVMLVRSCGDRAQARIDGSNEA